MICVRQKMLLFLLAMPISCIAKVLFITHSYNRPEFIEMQYKTFKKFMSDDYEYVVFNDAKDESFMHQINNTCAHNNIRCIRVPQDIHTRPYLRRMPGDNLQQANIRHANCVQYSLDVIGFDYDGIVCILDSDMFLVRPISLENYMADKHIASFMKRAPNKIFCLCPAFCILNMKMLPNKKSLDFNTGKIYGWPVDSGGFTYYYLINHPELRVVSASSLYSHQLFLGDTHLNRSADHSIPKEVKAAFYENIGFNDTEINFLLKKPDTFEFYLDNHFLHYRDGSNDTRQSKEYHINKFQLFSEFINAILN